MKIVLTSGPHLRQEGRNVGGFVGETLLWLFSSLITCGHGVPSRASSANICSCPASTPPDLAPASQRTLTSSLICTFTTRGRKRRGELSRSGAKEWAENRARDRNKTRGKNSASQSAPGPQYTTEFLSRLQGGVSYRLSQLPWR